MVNGARAMVLAENHGLWTGFRPKSEKFDFGQKGYHAKGHLKRSRMA